MKKIMTILVALGMAGMAYAQCQNFNKGYGGFNRFGGMQKMGGYPQMHQKQFKQYGGFNGYHKMPKQYGGYNGYQKMPKQYGGYNRYVQPPQYQPQPQFRIQPAYGFGQRSAPMMNRYSPFRQTQPMYRQYFIRR